MQIPAKIARELIQRVMDEQYVSIRELARIADVSDATLYKIMNEKRDVVFPSTIRAITDVYPEYTIKRVNDEFVVDRMQISDVEDIPTSSADGGNMTPNVQGLIEAIKRNDLRSAMMYALEIQGEK